VQPEPFEDSRRLTGCNFYFAGTGAALETAPGVAFDGATLEAWRANIAAARAALSWPGGETVIRRHRSGASLAFAAPPDQLYVATEVNEWAWWAALLPSSPREKVPEGRMRAETSSRDEPYRRHFPLPQELLAAARNLRATSTKPEQLVWSFLRNRRIHDQKFRRQQQMGSYVLDFYCHDLRLAVELDGSQHGEPGILARDQQREAFLLEEGVRTLRYWNHDVLSRTETVLEDIWHQVDDRLREGGHIIAPPSSALRPPSPGGRREAESSWPHAPGHAAAWDADSAMRTLQRLAAAEANPKLVALIAQAARLGLPLMADDDEVTLGAGAGGRTWFVDELPGPDEVPWPRLHAIPTALVTGSNGKTTSVRLLAAMCRAHGWPTAHSCTDGVYFEGSALETGDFSGPGGARAALRQSGAQAAILETARGGMLRRGLALCRADVALVTNISADHFGEYGVHDLDDLAAVKLTVARAVDAGGLLVLNADDPALVRHAAALDVPIGWFALDFDHPLLASHRERGRPACGVRGGELLLHVGGDIRALGPTASMPLTLGDRAVYNIANLAGAALTAAAMGIPADAIAATLARFGHSPGDNPGRLQHWRFGATEVFLDYAHNPEGLQGLLRAVGAPARRARMAIVLGHAGNREDADLRAVASTAASARPELVVLKDIAGYERGRGAGEVASIMRAQLLADGVLATAVATCLEEVDAARVVLRWAADGDLLVLPIHEMEAREQLTRLLDAMAAAEWRAGQPLP
jgi:UDP-N-acetylmuramyl tripeptide synthase/very-short-patch-repair endonuclease